MFTVICFIAILACVHNLHFVPERAEVKYFNPHYLHNASFNVRRYSRRSAYYINIQLTTKHTWGNNITVHLIDYEYLHNEYKRSFVEMHFKVCDMMKNDPYVGRAIAIALAKFHVPCPAPSGVYKLMNISVPMDNFSNVWPFDKFKVEVILEQKPTNDIIVKGDIYVHVGQDLAKRFKNRTIDGAVINL